MGVDDLLMLHMRLEGQMEVVTALITARKHQQKGGLAARNRGAAVDILISGRNNSCIWYLRSLRI